jgi:hypothetical protein
MSNFFKYLKPKADLSKHGFDLSQRKVLTMPAGALLPVLNLPCVPGDYHEIRVSDLLRAMPLQTAAFVRAKQQIDFFFVPYVQLWRRWPSFISQRKDPVSTATIGQPLYAPNFSIGSLLGTLLNLNQTLAVDSCNFGLFHGAIRLLDLLGYGNFLPLCSTTPLGSASATTTGTDDTTAGQFFNSTYQALNEKYMNLWPILAYNKIWSDYYRNPYWDTTVNPRIFNVDNIEGTSVANSHISSSLFSDMFQLRYRSWKKDYFTSLLPDSQFGGVSIASLQPDFALNASPVNNDSSRLVLYQASTTTGGRRIGVQGLPNDTFFTAETGISVLELRKAEALQAWREKVIRAGYRSKDNSLAHFGVAPQFEEDSHALFLGSVESNIVIDDVTATAQTNEGSGGVLGDLGGKGVSFQNNGEKINFKCSDFGVIMAIMSVVPENEYNSYGFDKDKTLIEPFDYFTPEFQNLGLEPVQFSECNLFYEVEEGANRTMGFAPRYHMYKSAYDKIHGELCHKPSDSLVPHWKGQFRHWVTPMTKLQTYYASSFVGFEIGKNMYITPSILDPVFYEAYDGFQSTDQFVCDIHFDIKSVRPMSVLGLPQF